MKGLSFTAVKKQLTFSDYYAAIYQAIIEKMNRNTERLQNKKIEPITAAREQVCFKEFLTLLKLLKKHELTISDAAQIIKEKYPPTSKQQSLFNN